jgi:voltage-gated potassium channel
MATQFERPLTDREVAAERLALRLDRPVAYLGVLALGLWLIEPFTNERDLLTFAVDVTWLCVAIVFVVEFGARLVAAPATWPFLRRHWWEVGLVALPFLRFLRAARAARGARGMAAAVRSSQRAGQQLQSRLVWLLIVTAVVALASGRLLWEYGGYHGSYADALHDAAMSTLTGAALGLPHAFAQVLEIALAAYSAVIIATIAGSIGAYFLESRSNSTPS